MNTRTRCSALLVLVTLAGCGGEEREAEAPPTARSQLTVTVFPEGPDGPAKERTVDCAGDAHACDVPLAETSPNVACTEIYGGPATATVKGTVGGEAVDTAFSLNNGCEIDRWRRAAELLGEPPRMQVP